MPSGCAATWSVIAALAQRPDVRHLYANPSVRLDVPVEASLAGDLPEGIEWNITLVGAPEVWALGYTGQGVVVGGADTGYDWDHPALIKNQYRGWDGSTASHDYNWFDATADPSLTPIDPFGHGTHTMGTMVGDDGGVEPDRHGAGGALDRLPQHGRQRCWHPRYLHCLLPVVHCPHPGGWVAIRAPTWRRM